MTPNTKRIIKTIAFAIGIFSFVIGAHAQKSSPRSLTTIDPPAQLADDGATELPEDFLRQFGPQPAALFSASLSASSPFLYVNNNAASNSVSAFRVNSDGTLTAVPGSPFATGGNSGSPCNNMDSIAVDQRHRRVYVTNGVSNTVSGFNINSDGSLSAVPGSPFATGAAPVGTAVDPLGRFVYVANHNGGSVFVYAIAAGGQLIPVPGSPFTTSAGNWTLEVHPSGNFLYAVSRASGNRIHGFAVSSSGSLTPVPGSPYTGLTNSHGSEITSDGRFLYVVDLVSTGRVRAYSVSSTNGALTPVAGSPFGPGNAQGVAVNPAGTLLFSSFSNSIRSYGINGSGGLFQVSGSPFPNSPGAVSPHGFVVSQDGKYLYAVNDGSPHVSAFDISATGALVSKVGSPYNKGVGGCSDGITMYYGGAVTNSEPAATADAYSINEDSPLSVSAPGVLANDTDAENEPLTVSLVSGPSRAASFDLHPDGSFEYTPAADFNGIDSFSYKANDGQADSGVVTVTMTVNAVNDAPVLAGVPATPIIDEQAAFSFTATATDVDGPAPRFDLVGAPTGASLDPVSGVFTWTPSETQGPGVYNFSVRATDSDGAADVRNTSIEVREANVAPQLSGVPASATIDELSLYTFTAAASDTDVPANSLMFSLVGAPSGAAIDPSSGAFTWTPDEAQGPGSYTFKVKLTDDGSPAMSDEKTITVTVGEVNVKPTLAGVPATHAGYWGNVIGFAATAADPDLPAGTLTFSLVGAPAGAAIDPSTGAFAWTPQPSQLGSFTFTVRVTDSGSAAMSDDRQVTITVGKRPTAIAYTGDGTEQYSDKQALAATLYDNGGGAMQGMPLAGRSVRFDIGAQTAANATDASGVASNDFVLTQDPTGTYSVVSSFAGDASYLGAADTDPFDITQEDARVYYTGTTSINTACPTCGPTATVTLSATIQDVSAVAGDPDTLPGDIRNASLKFVNRDAGDAELCTASLGLVDPADARTATATCNWSANIGTNASQMFTIGIVVGGHYTRDALTDNFVFAASPQNGSVSGNGVLTFAASGGRLAGDPGTEADFGFSIKSDKKGPKGAFAITVLRRESDGLLHSYLIEGIATAPPAVQLLGKKAGIATFTGRATIRDVTFPLNMVTIDDGAVLQVVVNDKGEPGRNDTIAVTLWSRSGGLWFSSNWNGVKTVEQTISGGNLQVK
jgi:6-phosphogluconolactonase (cycloisomerase 2 family)